MGTKNNPGKYDCYAKAEPDEPFFVLLARDPIAANLVRLWADIADSDGVDDEKINEAMSCADAMDRWRMRRIVAAGTTSPDQQELARRAVSARDHDARTDEEVADAVTSHVVDAAAPPEYQGPCVALPYSSRMCELGTKGCNVQHAAHSEHAIADGVAFALTKRADSWRDAMVDKLLANAHKGGPEGWEHDDSVDLFARVEEELEEFRKAWSLKRPVAVLRHEAADVANMIMMVVDSIAAREPSEKPAIFSCGCSHLKVEEGLCDVFNPDGTEREPSEDLPSERRPGESFDEALRRVAGDKGFELYKIGERYGFESMKKDPAGGSSEG